MMIEKKKTYIGTFKSEVDAAKVYDELSIQINGAAAKTNFSYTKSQVEEILERGFF